MCCKKSLLLSLFILLFISLFIIPADSLAALDDAEFWNLGFSADSRYMCFAQYWVDSRGLFANAEIRVVDMKRNSFVSNGSAQLRSTMQVSVGGNGRNSVLDLVRGNNAVLSSYAIEHMRRGRIVYLRVGGGAASNTIDFQDFQSDNHYSIRLISSRNSSGVAFSIRGSITLADGTRRDFSVGLPDYYRPNVVSYTVSQIIVAPDNRSHVFVIEQLVDVGGIAPVARYMVETLSID